MPAQTAKNRPAPKRTTRTLRTFPARSSTEGPRGPCAVEPVHVPDFSRPHGLHGALSASDGARSVRAAASVRETRPELTASSRGPSTACSLLTLRVRPWSSRCSWAEAVAVDLQIDRRPPASPAGALASYSARRAPAEIGPDEWTNLRIEVECYRPGADGPLGRRSPFGTGVACRRAGV